MIKIFKLLLVLIALAAVIFGLWYYQPWSNYSPAKIASLEHPDKLTWNMQNMRELVPSRTVAKGEEVSSFSENLQPLELTYQFQGQTKTLAQFLEESTTGGLLVLKNGKVVHERYLQGASRETLFTSWSMAKSFVATAIAMAQKEGRIRSLEDTVETYAPQFAGTDYGQVKITELLAMSSGINFIEIYGEGKSDVRPFFFDSFILGKNPDELLKPFKQTRPPFTDFDYVSSNSHVLSAVVRGAYGKPLYEVMSEEIWRPLGMEGDANWLLHRNDAQGQSLGYCCLNARVRDYARFGQFYLQALKGEGLGAKVLPEGWAASLAQPASDLHQPGAARYSGRGYSQHFWLPADAPGVFMAVGVYGQFIWIDANNDLVIVRTSADPTWTARYPESEAVLKAISEHYQ